MAYDSQGNQTVINDKIKACGICVANNGDIYVKDMGKSLIWLLDSRGPKASVGNGVPFLCGTLCLTPDQSLLLAADRLEQFVYSFHIKPDGTLSDRQPYHHLCIPDGVMESGAEGMTVDTHGMLYVSTHMGIQMCEQAGRVQGIISAPQGVELSNIVFGGANFDEMFAFGTGGQIFKRKLKATGVLSFQPPIKPTAPSL